jgi:hypothetical protein
MLLAALLLAVSPCQAHQLSDQHMDAATVRRVDSAWSVAFVRADTAFLRCLLTSDYVGYSRTGVVADRATELAKSLRSGDPNKPLPEFPSSATVEFHGASVVVTGIYKGVRWIDVYRFEGGTWHAWMSADQPIPGSS